MFEVLRHRISKCSLLLAAAFATAVLSSAPDALAVCGDGTVDVGEACDDGNTQPHDCCAPDCSLEPNGVACGSGDICERSFEGACNNGVCDADDAPCFYFNGGNFWCGMKFAVRNSSSDRRDRLRLKNLVGRGGRADAHFGGGVSPDLIGAPMVDTTYYFCGVRETVAPATETFLLRTIPPGASWSPSGDGFRHIDRERSSGFGDIIIEPLRVRIVGRGEGLMLPEPFSTQFVFDPDNIPRFTLVNDRGLCIQPLGGRQKNGREKYSTHSRCSLD